MLLLEQTAAQPPQLFLSLVVLTSQPSVCLLPSQSAKPEAHVPLQAPLTHATDDRLFVEQTIPQPPQLLGSLLRLVSQPSDCLSPLQSAKPLLHAPLHDPPAHVGMAMLRLEHTRPQPPQLPTS